MATLSGLFRQLVARSPAKPDLPAIGRLVEEGRLDEAEARLHALGATLADPYAQMLFARIRREQGRVDEAVDVLEGLLSEDLEWFAPGHGYLVAEPHAVLRGLVRHRLAREAKVRAALEALREGAIEDLLPVVYDDVPKAIHPVAARSLLAHLLKLRDDGVAAADGERWRSLA